MDFVLCSTSNIHFSESEFRAMPYSRRLKYVEIAKHIREKQPEMINPIFLLLKGLTGAR